jgi:hypothetical protein
MFPKPLPCTDANECASLGDLSHHPVVEMTNILNGRAKMHVNLLCEWINDQPN